MMKIYVRLFFRYPTENDRRFRCGQSDLCISVKYLCDGVSDCKEVNNNDDEDLCPWRANISLSQVQRTFMCKNRIFWATTVRCDDFNDCADGEDELFCHLDGRTRSSSIPPESLVIDVISLSNSLILTDPFQKDITWYCNGGLPVRNSSRLNELFCLCPYSYYGEQCEFQRRRVKIHISLIVSDRYLEMNAVIKLVIYLINRNSLEIIDYKERLVMAQRNPFTSQIVGTRQHQVQLLFPTDNYFDAITFVKIDAFIVTKTSLEYQASWYYDLKFPFLPIQTHAFELHLPAPTPVVGSCVHGQLRPYVNNMSRTWCHCNAGWRGAKCDQFDSICQSHTCSLGSICVPTKNYPICLCTLYNQGPSCRVQMDLSCLLNPCQNNGTCLRLYYLRSVSMCICQEHHTGTYCETEKRRVYISTESDLVEKYLRVSIMTIYFYSTLPFTDYFMLSSQYLRLLRNVQLNENIPPIFIAGYGPIQFGFAQFLTSLSDRFGEYFLILRQNHAYTYKIEVINTTIRSKNRCPHIRELFNSTILSMQPINRMKWYHEPCQNNYELACFFDEQLMCLCTRQHLTQCATFFHQITNCSERYRCLNDGLCVQESNINNPLDYFCICQECYFGDLCQFTTSQYSISLDSLIGQTIKTDVAFQEQPIIVISSFIIVLISIVIGLLLNGFTILLFIYQNKCRETGSGLYILTTSCFGVLSLLVLGLKLISLVFNLFMSNKFGCMTIEYLLKYLPTVADWMNTFVSLERFWVTKKKTKFDKKKSRHIAKRVIPLSIFIILISLLHDPFHRESVVDLRLDYGRRAWCVVQFESQFIRIYNMIINIIHYICPFMISLIAIIFILIDFTRVRVKAKQQAFKLVFSEQLSLLKHWIISPIVLAILALPRIIFSLTFTCISKDTPWQHILIISYFIAFLPHISSLVIFVLPSKTYMKQLKIFIKIAR